MQNSQKMAENGTPKYLWLTFFSYYYASKNLCIHQLNQPFIKRWCATEFFRQRPNFSADLAEYLCQELATLASIRSTVSFADAHENFRFGFLSLSFPGIFIMAISMLLFCPHFKTTDMASDSRPYKMLWTPEVAFANKSNRPEIECVKFSTTKIW
jgi:hypothetical protein